MNAYVSRVMAAFFVAMLAIIGLFHQAGFTHYPGGCADANDASIDTICSTGEPDR